jgi:Cu/Ag efflux pump CusA
VTTTVEGRERYTVSIRYPRDLRRDPQAIVTQLLIPVSDGATVPLGQVGQVKLARGPATIRMKNSQLAVYIYVDLRDRDLGGYVADAQRPVANEVKFPPAYYVSWNGQFEYMERAKARLQIVVPITILVIFLLLYLNFRRVTETLIVMLSVPFALVGGLWLMWVAVAVGFIALAGVAAETGVVMLSISTMPLVLSGGLDKLIKGFQDSGHGKVAQSWIGTGPNQEVAPNDLAAALGRDTIDALTKQTGMARADLLAVLRQNLPDLIDQLTPNGRLPTAEEASRML